MKNIFANFKGKIAWTILMISIGLLSCEDYLEVVPKEQVSDLTLWVDEGNADLFLNGIYGGITVIATQEWCLGEPAWMNNWGIFDCFDNFTDNSISQYPWTNSRGLYVQGIETPGNPSDIQQWVRQYPNIRACNVFISNVEASDMDEDWKGLRLAEARFLRAYFYSLLWTFYGGVPIITEPLDRNTMGGEIFMERATDAETFQFIVDECEAIADDLPPVPTEARAGRGSALTLKGWCELFYASPLKNPSNDLTRWVAAAATNKEVIDLGVYSLFPDHETLLYEENNNNSEIIFSKTFLGGTTLGNSKAGLQPPAYVGGKEQSWSGCNLTQELIDEYAMANGLPITDPASGYDPQNPYVNREQRFYNDVIYDGSTWLGEEIVYYTGSGSLNELDLDFGGTGRPCTVYHPRKAIEEKYCQNGNNLLSSANWAIFRYAEVLLSYAEAQNEAVGPDALVYSAVNEVRARVDLPPLQAGLSQAEMRTAIHRERRVELCLEDKRWFDMMRLKLAEIVMNQPVHTMQITESGGTKTYTVVPTGGDRHFDPDKNYVLPIPQSAIDQNENLVQNPNYGSN